MAELALLGLVANIFQFVETGIKIASSARDVYQCAENFQTREIRLLLEDIKQTGEEVAKLPHGALSDDELAICKYSEECNSIAAELDVLAAKLSKKDGTKSRTLDSMRIAIYNHRKRNEIQELVTRLNRVDGRLRTKLQKVLRQEAGTEDDETWSRVMAAVERVDVKAGILDFTQGHVLEKAAQTLKAQLRTEALVGDLVKMFAEEIRTRQYYQSHMDTLVFQDIKQRYSDIDLAHQVTFKWAFDRKHTEFAHWLESGSGFFWVHGLAGSGKSTLMKYLYEHTSTKALLREWAKGRKLVTASFFFWALGTRMQKSQLGLLQSLLFQLVRADTSLATALFSSRSRNEPWTVAELREAFKTASTLAGDHTKYCFFIDGLDEYEGHETDIISTISDLLHSSNIKICLSSRPWNRFREAYAKCPGLTLEYLTKTDILEYTKFELLSNNSFQRTMEMDPRCNYIITQISDQARGVFLWVFLVIRNLLRDITSQEPFDHLQRRVNELPRTLEDYFQRIFDRIDAIYRQQTARLFLVALHLEERNEDPLPLMAYTCLEVEVQHPTYAARQRLLARDPKWLECLPENVAEYQRTAMTRLDDRCKDLLQPRRNESFHPASLHHFHISLLHRTVRDFFRDNYYGTLVEKAGEGFSPEGSIANCFLWLFKTFPITLFFYPSLKEREGLSDEVRVQVHKSRQQNDYKMSHALYQFWSHVMKNESSIDDQTIESFFETMVTYCDQDWPLLIVPLGLTGYFTNYPPEILLIPWASYLNLESYLRRNWISDPGRAKDQLDYGTLALRLALEPRGILALPRSAGNATTPLQLAKEHHGSFNQASGSALSPAPIRPSAVRTLLALGCDATDRKLGLAFLERFRQARRWDAKTVLELAQAAGSGERAYLSNRNVFEVTRALFEHGFSIPLAPHAESVLCKANFGVLFRPYFGAEGIAELAGIRRRLQEELSLTRRLTRAFWAAGS
ncbi:uncharacterized protein PG998_012083 [Apiospora kogelbergensis]|uniref:uncharacterized protein n=1 Tax=Apiospora kogelbergensis TaxID=1337665 RepID=UPI00312E8B23